MNLTSVASFSTHCTKMYPMALMDLSPLSGKWVASFPHVLESSGHPPVPNPILESQVRQVVSWLPRIPILALEKALPPEKLKVLNPSLLQLRCKEAADPRTLFQVSRPSEVARYCPSAISEYRELARLLITTKLI